MKSTSLAALISVVVLSAGCPKDAPAPIIPPPPMHPDLICPEGTIPAGKVPPAGYEAWCHAVNAQGMWLRQGPALTFHHNGSKQSQGEYIADRREGTWSYWFPTGELEKQGAFAGGVEDGFWTGFHTDGSHAAEGIMVEGHEHGDWTYWSDDGASRTEAHWSLGKQTGTWVTYDTTTDSPKSETDYRDGRMLGARDL